VLAALLVSTLVSPALAVEQEPDCKAKLAAIDKTDKEGLPSLFAEVAQCDKKLAADSFNRFMREGDDTAVLVDLSLKAVEHEIYEPVWDMLEQIADYQVREEIARRVGAMCRDNVGVLPFLRGGYYAMNERAFGMWSEAFVTCPSEELTEWLVTEIASPPARTYDDKYNSLLGALVDRQGPKSLSSLEQAAIASSERGGPFSSVLEKMQDAARPGGVGTKMTDADKERLAKALVRVGNGVRPEQAALVADRLYSSGFKSEAAGLLKVVWGDRVQSDGRLMYGITSTEHCGGEAVVHVAAVYEPSTRWSVREDIMGPAKAFKQRLKCDTDEWKIRVTPSPVKSEDDIDAFAAETEADWAAKNLVVKIRKEKPIELP
jgi:hypothetical protein